MLLPACNKVTSRPVSVIEVDIDSVSTIEVDTARLVRLQSSDSSMIFDICSLIEHDGQLIIHSRNYLRMFDAATGKYLGDVARQGSEDDNFSMIGNIWMAGDTLNLFDVNRQRISSYSTDGRFLAASVPFDAEDQRPGEHPRIMTPWRDGYLTVNSFSSGSTKRNPAVSFYGGADGGGAMKGRELREGGFTMDGLYTDSMRALYWEPLRDTIFTVDTDRGVIEPLYAVDFGELYAFKPVCQQLPHLKDRVKAFRDDKQHRASFIRYVQPEGSSLYFTFMTNDGQNFMARYDEKTRRTRTFSIAAADGRYRASTFFKIEGDSAIIEVNDTQNIESNPLIYKLPLTQLQ